MGSNVSGYESDMEQNYSEEGGNDTDVDAVVNEYQEEIRVATLNGEMPMFPTPATGRRACLAVAALIPCSLALATSVNLSHTNQFTGIMLGISSGLMTFLLLVVISRQPQRKRGPRPKPPPQNSSSSSPSSSIIAELENSASVFFEYSIIPWVPAGAIFLHCCLLLQGLDLAATPFAFWLAIGMYIWRKEYLL